MTPETDAAVIASNGQWSFVLKETCQRLERERNKAVEDATNYFARIGELEKERDEAREKYFAMRDLSNNATELAEKYKRQRDEAQKHLQDIGEYGTEEINAAVELRQKLAAALVERDEAREALENHMAATIHTCHDECKRPVCVLRRERDEVRKEAEYYKERYEQLKDQYGR